MKIIITGSEGLLGKKLIEIFSKKFDVIGIDIKKNNYKLDIIEKEKIIDFFKKIKPNFVIHAAAYTNVDGCEEKMEYAYNVNVRGTKNVLEACHLISSKVVYISTDFVFDGKRGSYREENIPNPINYYAKTKFEAEKLVKKFKDFLIIRTSVLYGYNKHGSSFDFVRWVIENLKGGQKLKIVVDQINSPTLIDDITIALIKLKDKIGIYNVAGSEAISRFDFALKIAEVFNLNKNLLIPVNSNKLKQIALRPKDVSLDISKINSLGIKMSNIKEGLLKMKRQIETDNL